MIKLFADIEKINDTCSSLVEDKKIIDYRIILNVNNAIDIYVVLDNMSKPSFEKLLESYEDVNINCYSKIEYEDPEFMESFIFEKEEKVNIASTRKRLANLLDPMSKVTNDIPIITFYSYKGGVGRSTTLASCASYLAINNKKKIVILDCDFEAPGFTNFYLTDPSVPIFSNGLIEYLTDENNSNKAIASYYWETSKLYSGEGEILHKLNQECIFS